MVVAAIAWNPDEKTLSEFSEVSLVALGMIAAPWLFFSGKVGAAEACWAAALAIRGVGWLSPRALRPVFLVLTTLSWPIGWIISNVMLAIVYYATVVPIGLALQLAGRDRLGRRFDRAAPSYWESHPRMSDGRDSLHTY